MSANSEHDQDQDGAHGDDLDLTAYALSQLDETERAEIERKLAVANGDARRVIEQTQRLAETVREALVAANPAASASLRETLIHRMEEQPEPGDEPRESMSPKPQPAITTQPFWRRYATEIVAAALVLILLAALLIPAGQFSRESARKTVAENRVRELPHKDNGEHLRYQKTPSDDNRDEPPILYPSEQHWREIEESRARYAKTSGAPASDPQATASGGPGAPGTPYYDGAASGSGSVASNQFYYQGNGKVPGGGTASGNQAGGGKQGGPPSAAYSVRIRDGSGQGGGQPSDGWAFRGEQWKTNNYDGQGRGSGLAKGRGQGERPEEELSYAANGGRENSHNIGGEQLGGQGQRSAIPGAAHGAMGIDASRFGGGGFGVAGTEVQPNYQTYQPLGGRRDGFGIGTEQYAPIVENNFIAAQGQDALSTFSIDVDTASYANVRRFLMQGQLPPPNAVRLEEMVNYFSYDYPQPKAGEPFSVNMEVAECPWQQKHLLLRVGLKGREIPQKERPVSNLVFLLDVSGSMADENKLPLLKQVLSMMVRELREDDRVSIVTYAGEAGLRLPPTTGDQQAKILGAIDSLLAGGSTNGSAGIELAYEQARAYFRKEGTNRVILATDGDLNVGITDDESLVRLIKEKAAGGTFLTVLGFGEGNLKDAKMERLADNGNGLYAYIDGVREGRKVLVEQMSGSLVTIAKDVKIQIEFNPREVQSYRLLGYENRMLTAQEFNDDKRDAGEIGAGHTVTALYELAPAEKQVASNQPSGEEEPLKYQAGERVQGSGFGVQEQKLTDAAASGELLTLKLRYKEPEGQASKLSEYPLKSRGSKFSAASKDFQFASAVASFGMLLRNSQYRGDGNLAAVAEVASAAIGEDKEGYRAEFVDLVRKAQALGVK